mmetsp:Transcript_24245/g.72847  ORF Transcript_24245/g.72847 Transcript_24245/m.72847 type:complete len:220 (+) Transcript_24245:776-1435(+)
MAACAPRPRNGAIAWAASPRSTVLPPGEIHERFGACSKMPQRQTRSDFSTKSDNHSGRQPRASMASRNACTCSLVPSASQLFDTGVSERTTKPAMSRRPLAPKPDKHRTQKPWSPQSTKLSYQVFAGTKAPSAIHTYVTNPAKSLLDSSGQSFWATTELIPSAATTKSYRPAAPSSRLSSTWSARSRMSRRPAPKRTVPGATLSRRMCCKVSRMIRGPR